MSKRRYLVKRADGDAGQLGGSGHLPAGTVHPKCKECDSELLLFFEFILPDDSGYESGTRLSAYMCPIHNDIPFYDPRTSLGPAYWKDAQQWAGFLVPPNAPRDGTELRLLQFQRLSVASAPDQGEGFIQIGGEPEWAQDAEQFVCACGAQMKFLCQVEEDYKFEAAPGAAEQPDSSYPDGYVLFLGNAVYAFACPRPCDTRSVWFTVQN